VSLAPEVKAAMRRLTGKDYRIDFTKLEPAELNELIRFCRDAEAEKLAAARRAQLTPWRRP
jgi:hypothetical protein